ncbi:lysophospholipid acyltransferase family protein [Maridesulfovibrio sp.]|uniref:lysophospholipid acyltransferase family protein n=1 Tax=Maridesulfovibrio sp. TaxID=2795000 RepID=UPI002AA608E2|nr:lysophospholipid acyltransferase family protein [Maridesulfovibrio sp.]
MKIKVDPVIFAPQVAFLYRWWVRSIRFDVSGYENIIEPHKQGKPVMLALWHNELFSLIGLGFLKKLPLVTMASDSKDGQIITDVLERIGYEVARGSSTRGGLKAMLGVARVMRKQGKIGAITMDGPKGPRHEVKPGILAIAQKTGAAIIPMRAYPANPVVFHKSWDRFELPKPFMPCRIMLGEPFTVTGQKLDDQVLAAEARRLEEVMASMKPD